MRFEKSDELARTTFTDFGKSLFTLSNSSDPPTTTKSGRTILNKFRRAKCSVPLIDCGKSRLFGSSLKLENGTPPVLKETTFDLDSFIKIFSTKSLKLVECKYENIIEFSETLLNSLCQLRIDENLRTLGNSD